MKFIIKNGQKENPVNLMRTAGYCFQRKQGQEFSFIRPLERAGYPRFHLFLRENEDELIFNLHLDQKRPIYKGTSAHSGEYEGVTVETEAERIKQAIQ